MICFCFSSMFAQKRIAFLHDPTVPVQQVGIEAALRDEGYTMDISGTRDSPVTSNTATLTVDSTADYYVSPSGSDHNSGSISAPFYSLNKAWSKLATTETSGKLIYMRGGTYIYPTPTSLTNKSGGNAGNLIKIWAYPGEKPVIDYSSFTPTTQIMGIYLNNANYVHIKGIRVTTIKEPLSGNIAQYGLILWNNVSNCIFDQMELDHIGGWGIVVGDNSNNNLFLNCDSHHNADPYTNNGDPYGWSDGFESASLTSTNNTLDGCRFWSNSDDGLDLRRANGVYFIKNCWSFWNGYKEDGITPGGNGEGFKLGGKSAPATINILRTVTNCLAFENTTVGFSPEPDLPENELGVILYNSTSYHNALGINFQYKNYAIVKNLIVYGNTVKPQYYWGQYVTHDHNSLDIPLTVTDADFVSVNSAGVDGPRQADGSLPKLDFLKLSPTSKLIDAGIDVGLPFAGVAPDLGAFETGMVTGISRKEIKNDFFRVYPNPVKDILYISAIKEDVKLISLKLYDIRGVEIYRSTETGDCKLDFSGYKSGIYILKIKSGSDFGTFKIIK
jgi:hypothetical protein